MNTLRTFEPGLRICPVCDRDSAFAITREGNRVVTRCECGALVVPPVLSRAAA